MLIRQGTATNYNLQPDKIKRPLPTAKRPCHRLLTRRSASILLRPSWVSDSVLIGRNMGKHVRRRRSEYTLPVWYMCSLIKF